MDSHRHQKGFTLTELLVSLSLFGVVGMSISSFMVDTMRRTSLESKMSRSTQEAQNAIQLATAELRLSSQISPYLPGTNVALSTCASAMTVDSTEIRFIVAHDAASGTNGLSRYYVGYRYDATTKQLIRGEIATASATTCSGSGNPTDASNGAVVASNIVRIDADGNGTIDPIFSRAGDLVTINLGVEVKVNSKLTATQSLSTEVLLRSN